MQTRISVANPEQVTQRGEEDGPEAGGLKPSDVRTIWKHVEKLYKTGLYPAISITLRRKGKLVLNRAIGHSHGNAPDDAKDAPKDLATTRTLFNTFNTV